MQNFQVQFSQITDQNSSEFEIMSLTSLYPSLTLVD